jgi:hypothetical protein
MWGHEMAKKIILTICAVFEFVLCVDWFTPKISVYPRSEGFIGILGNASESDLTENFWYFSVANVVFGFVVVWIWTKSDGEKAQGDSVRRASRKTDWD